MDASLYDTPGFCRHGLQVSLVNKRQFLFVPVLQSRLISEAAVILELPLRAEELSAIVLRFFAQMQQRVLPLHTPYKSC